MLTLLLNPFIRKIVIGVVSAVALLVAYSIWSAHMQSVGAIAEKAKEQAVAIEHQQEVTSKAAAVDQDVSKDPTPQDTLQKNWSQP
jgi:hypothetical protein